MIKKYIVEEWKGSPEGEFVNPTDDMFYVIPLKAIEQTKKVLSKYGTGKYRSEGMVYWTGTIDRNMTIVKSVICPKLEASRFHCEISVESNLKVVEIISEINQRQIAQVHSHPSKWVGHSPTDDEKAAFKVKGLLSLVVSSYGKTGMLPLTRCGVHRFEAESFIRLANEYIVNHMEITDEVDCAIYDLRK